MSDLKFWHVCYLKPRTEKIVLKKIEDLNFEVFLPLVKHIKVYKKLKKKVFLPLIPGYIFVNISPGHRHHITAISEVYRFLKFKDEYAKISQQEISNLMLITNCVDYHNDICVQTVFQKGKDIEVLRGPFMGLKGKMVKCVSGNRVVVEIKAIERYISISINMKDIVPLESTSL